jgi:transposase
VLPYADKLLRSLVVDRARWHTSEKVVVPEGIFLEYLPPYSPELQPAERLWCLADELKVNKSFDSLDDATRRSARLALSNFSDDHDRENQKSYLLSLVTRARNFSHRITDNFPLLLTS